MSQLTIIQQLQSPVMMGEFKKALPMTVKFSPEQFVRIAITVLRNNQKLAQCSPTSILGGIMTAAQLGLSLEPSLGQSFLVPFWNGKDKCMECQFQIGYKGYVNLGYRAGMRMIQAHAVFEGDEFDCEYGLQPMLIHRPLAANRTDVKKLIATYAVGILPSGEKIFEVMNRDELAYIREKTKSRNKEGEITGPWVTDPIPMFVKIPIRKLTKWFPTSDTEMGQANWSDGGVHRFEKPGETIVQIPEWDLESGETQSNEPAPLSAEDGPSVPLGAPQMPNKWMTESQRKKIYAILNQMEKSKKIESVDKTKQEIYKQFNIESLNDLTSENAGEVIQTLESMGGTI